MRARPSRLIGYHRIGKVGGVRGEVHLTLPKNHAL